MLSKIMKNRLKGKKYQQTEAYQRKRNPTRNRQPKGKTERKQEEAEKSTQVRQKEKLTLNKRRDQETKQTEKIDYPEEKDVYSSDQEREAPC